MKNIPKPKYNIYWAEFRPDGSVKRSGICTDKKRSTDHFWKNEDGAYGGCTMVKNVDIAIGIIRKKCGPLPRTKQRFD